MWHPVCPGKQHICYCPRQTAIPVIKWMNGVAHYIDYYNTRRYHQGIDYQIPAARYAAAIAA